MLIAKKKAHSIYSFIRKEDFFIKLNNLVSDKNEDNKLKQIRKMIILNNMHQFSSLLENCTQFERDTIIKNNDKIVGYIKQGKWKKGQKYQTKCQLKIQIIRVYVI